MEKLENELKEVNGVGTVGKKREKASQKTLKAEGASATASEFFMNFRGSWRHAYSLEVVDLGIGRKLWVPSNPPSKSESLRLLGSSGKLIK